MPLSAELNAALERFESLPVSDETSAERKRVVRSLQSGVQNQSLALTEDEFRACRDGDASIGRILAYLYAEGDRVRSGLAERRGYVLTEWERLQHSRFPLGVSTMPLYYAVRCYLTYLKNNPEARVGAQADEELFVQITRVLPEKRLDSGEQVQGAIKEIVSLIHRSREEQVTPAVAAALLTRRGVIVAATISASSALLVGLIANWEKIAGPGIQQGSESLVADANVMPFQTGWIFVGYYDAERQVYVEGPYALVAFRPTGADRGPLVPALGDVMEVTKDRRVIIANYREEGLKHQMTSPPLIHDQLSPVDETGVTLPQGAFVIVRDVEMSGYKNRPASVWLRVAACDSQTDACARATAEVKQRNSRQ